MMDGNSWQQIIQRINKPRVLIGIAMSILLLVAAIVTFSLLSSSPSSVQAVFQARAYIFKAVQSPEQSNLETIGVIDFTDIDGGLTLNGTIQGLTPGLHGFHIHQFGELGQLCAAAGPHLNPHGKTHGAPDSRERHVGDLGNVQADANGVVNVQIRDNVLALEGVNSLIGRGLVVHEKADDMGRGGNEESKKTGNAGKRVGCGVVGVKAEQPPRSSGDRKSVV